MDKKFGKYETIDEFIKGEFPWIDKDTIRRTYAIDKNRPLPIYWIYQEWPPRSIFDAMSYAKEVPSPAIHKLPIMTVADRDHHNVYYYAFDSDLNVFVELVRV